MMYEIELFSSTSSDFIPKLAKRLLQEKNLVFLSVNDDEISPNLQKHVVELNYEEHNQDWLLENTPEARSAFFEYLENIEARFRDDGNFSLILTFTDTLEEHAELTREGGEYATAWQLIVHDIRSHQGVYSYKHNDNRPEIYMNMENIYFIEIRKSDKRDWNNVVQGNDNYDWDNDPLAKEMNAIINPLLGLSDKA